MKHSILILASALAIFIVTLFVTNDYMSNETVQEADRINDLQIQEVTRRMNLNLLIREKAVHSFLSGMFYYDINDKNGHKDTLVYISEKEIPRFKNYVYASLQDFVKLNPHTHCATFLIDPSVYPDKGKKGYAPLIKHGDSTHYDIADNYNFLASKSYKEIHETHNCKWCLPSKKSPLYGKSIIYYVPIMRQSGDIFGAFAINVNIDAIRAGLTESLPYNNENSFTFAADSQGNIILSTNKFQEQFNNISDYIASLKTEGKYHKLKVDSIHHDVVTWDGKEYFVYHRKLEHAGWQIITVCSKDAIYEDVTNTRNIIIIVSAIGMLLMLMCCVVVFRREKTHLQQKAAAEEELKMAAEVQKSLLKPHHPSPFTFNSSSISLNAFMRPAREAGGDLYDYVKKDGKLLFCIGDVSGKGMPAALFMTQVVSLFRNICKFYDQPDLMVSQINNVLAENNPDMTFCTFFLGSFDSNTKTLTFCNAGHNRPIIVPSKESGNRPSYLHVNSNIAIGLMENFHYEAETLTLNEGDTLLLYTDGVTEAKNASHQMFGDDRLLTVAVTPTTDAVSEAVDSFVNGNIQSDDITIMTVHSA